MNRQHKRVQFIVLIVLLSFFVGMSFMIVSLGARGYQRINEASKETFYTRTPLSYLRMKVRQADQVNGLTVSTIQGQSALVLQEEIDDVYYQTWIYCYEGTLRECYVGSGMVFEPDAGDVVMELAHLEVTWQGDHQLRFNITSRSGTQMEESITLQCAKRRE